MRFLRDSLRDLWRMCWKCEGEGEVKVTIQHIPRPQLSDQDAAEQMVLGGWQAKIIFKTCPRCEGTGVRKRFR
jgi:hypothetical protein